VLWYNSTAMLSLLIVDDEQGIRTGVANYFPWASLGIEVAGICENGADALTFLSRTRVDMVLCDIRMPEMDGIRFAEIVTERKYRCEIVFISAHKDFEYARRAIELGIKHYIVKPAGYEELRDVFTRISSEIRDRQEAAESRREPETDRAGISASFGVSAGTTMCERTALLVEKDLKNVTLTGIADQLAMSPNHVSYRFHQETGKTFSRFLLEARMGRAEKLLNNPSLRVYEIGELVGYASPKSFIRAFKRFFGHSPRAHRRGSRA